jgi:hydrogenase maturation protein HypF
MKIETREIIITGIVQGVGFRPFVYNLAIEKGLNGFVYNDFSGVTIVIQGLTNGLDSFEKSLRENAPSKSKIINYISTVISTAELYNKFEIRQSPEGGERSAAVIPDLDICDDCLAELFEPTNRRYLYPFINCTNCGPRFTIIQDIPYDRPKTTMNEFQMCPDCQAEYSDPSNRRFHAQPNACPVCGPHLELVNKSGKVLISVYKSAEYEHLFNHIGKLLEVGNIIAIKGIGGFHLACDATNENAVVTLRSRKYRQDKPFAVMFHNLNEIKKFCLLNDAEIKLLQSVPHPIVLLTKKRRKDLAYSVAPNNHFLGVMLPYTSLHHLIFHFFSKPLIMTSGNVSDEPIAYKNEDALNRLKNIADYFLVNNREIHIRCDDSVLRIWNSKPYPLRRSRGFAPDKLDIKWRFDQPVLACGPEQKNTFALAKNDSIFLSHHIGDMENFEALRSFDEGIEHYKRIFEIEPEIIAYDLHPDYLSTKYALNYPNKKSNGNKVFKVGVQHHHAHAVSCMLDNQITQPVLAIVLDGTGFGNDETVWGGELLLAEIKQFKRLGYFKTVRLPGGTAAIKNPWQMGISYLYEVFGKQLPDIPFVKALNNGQVSTILKLLNSRINSPLTSSCGRLFDGVAAIAGLRNRVNYEGQAAIEFEQMIADSTADAYEFNINESNESYILSWQTMIRQLVDDIKNGIPVSAIALKFHNGLARGFGEWVEIAGMKTGIREVVLSGGVFMNIYLLTRLKMILEKKDFNVYTHHDVPCNDGGIALGQAVIASAQLAGGE